MQALAITLDCPPELDGKTLLLKTTDALLLRHREAGIDWEYSSLLASFHTNGKKGVTKGVTQLRTLRTE